LNPQEKPREPKDELPKIKPMPPTTAENGEILPKPPKKPSEDHSEADSDEHHDEASEVHSETELHEDHPDTEQESHLDPEVFPVTEVHTETELHEDHPDTEQESDLIPCVFPEPESVKDYPKKPEAPPKEKGET
jgi:hypothetical protein